jgi:hypothetical protein
MRRSRRPSNGARHEEAPAPLKTAEGVSEERRSPMSSNVRSIALASKWSVAEREQHEKIRDAYRTRATLTEADQFVADAIEELDAAEASPDHIRECGRIATKARRARCERERRGAVVIAQSMVEVGAALPAAAALVKCDHRGTQRFTYIDSMDGRVRRPGERKGLLLCTKCGATQREYADTWRSPELLDAFLSSLDALDWAHRRNAGR